MRDIARAIPGEDLMYAFVKDPDENQIEMVMNR